MTVSELDISPALNIHSIIDSAHLSLVLYTSTPISILALVLCSGPYNNNNSFSISITAIDATMGMSGIR